MLGASREKIVLDKKDAFNFFSVFKSNINHECYEEDCTFGEVVDHYGSSEQSVGQHGLKIVFSVNFHLTKEETDSKLSLCATIKEGKKTAVPMNQCGNFI